MKPTYVVKNEWFGPSGERSVSKSVGQLSRWLNVPLLLYTSHNFFHIPSNEPLYSSCPFKFFKHLYFPDFIKKSSIKYNPHLRVRIIDEKSPKGPHDKYFKTKTGTKVREAIS